MSLIGDSITIEKDNYKQEIKITQKTKVAFITTASLETRTQLGIPNPNDIPDNSSIAVDSFHSVDGDIVADRLLIFLNERN